MPESCKLKTGRPKRFSSPEELWDKACLFFSYCQENPIPKQFFRRGKLVTIYKVREMPFKDLYTWLGVYDLRYYKKQPDFFDVVIRIEYVVYQYNFIYAAAGLLRGRSVGHVVRKSLRNQSTRENNSKFCQFINSKNSGSDNPIELEKVPLAPFPSIKENDSRFCQFINSKNFGSDHRIEMEKVSLAAPPSIHEKSVKEKDSRFCQFVNSENSGSDNRIDMEKVPLVPSLSLHKKPPKKNNNQFRKFFNKCHPEFIEGLKNSDSDKHNHRQGTRRIALSEWHRARVMPFSVLHWRETG
jgi:DNA-packaging protein gp3